jgi:cytidine deaminase
MTDRDLIAAAVAARRHAHAPYSRFLVGAAVRDEQGRIHGGCNVENAAYPEGLCAEAGALSAMVLAGGRRCLAAAVAGAGEELVTPCGGCRQKLAEFASPSTPVHICDENGNLRRTLSLADLLPFSFGPCHLDSSEP